MENGYSVIVKFAIFLIFVLLGYLTNQYSWIFKKNIKRINPREARELIKHNHRLAILDIRGKYEYQDNHIRRAKSMPLGDLKLRMCEVEKYKDRPVLVYCASGNRSIMAAKILAKNGFKEIIMLKGGYKGWINEA